MGIPDRQRLCFVFDIGGVLLDWNPHYLYDPLFSGDRDAAERFLAEIGFADWNAQQDAGRPFKEAVADLSARFPAHADLIAAYDAHWEESIAGAHWDTVAVLESLWKAGYPLYALSNWSSEKYALVRHKFSFFDRFEYILISGEVKLAKPDPRIFELFLKRIGRAAGECVYIDDSAANITVVRSLGFIPIHFQSAAQLVRALERLQVLPA